MHNFRSWHLIFAFLVSACASSGESSGESGDPCTSNAQCNNGCCFNSSSGDNWCSFSGSGCMGGGSSSSSSSTGACAYYSSNLGRVVCGTGSSKSCSGKFLGSGTTCAGFKCTSKTNPNSCTTSASSSSGGSSGSSGSSCSKAWTCAYDGQATPMCSWACTKTGSERSQTCAVLASMLDNGNAGQCCSVCK